MRLCRNGSNAPWRVTAGSVVRAWDLDKDRGMLSGSSAS